MKSYAQNFVGVLAQHILTKYGYIRRSEFRIDVLYDQILVGFHSITGIIFRPSTKMVEITLILFVEAVF